MTIKKVIEMADELEPNLYTFENKKAWLGVLDGQIFDEVLKTHENCPTESFAGYEDATDDTELLVPFPYAQDVYVHYLHMQMALMDRETNKYNIAAQMFGVAYQAYAAKYNREHMPVHTYGNRFRI